jgi:hypothetical protein
MTTTPRHIFVHVGCPKTGTTFLQSTVWQSRRALRSHGVELPVDRVSHYHLALAVREQLKPGIDPPHVFTVMDRFATALAESTAPTILISNENLASAPAENAARLMRLIEEAQSEAEIHLVITARKLDRQLPAAWQQMIQHRRTLEWETYLRHVREGTGPTDFLGGHDVADIAERWAPELPAHRVHIVTVPPPSAPRELLLERFCQVVGIDPALVANAAPTPNESLGWVQAELLRRVNVALGGRLGHSRAGFGRVGKRYFAREVLAPMSGPRMSMPPEMAPWCQEHTDRIIATIEKEGYDVVGDLDDLRIGPTSPAMSPVTDGQIAEVAVKALADVLEQRHHDLEQIDALQERASRPRRRRRSLRRKLRRLARRIRSRTSAAIANKR